jgi:hypothetical protein
MAKRSSAHCDRERPMASYFHCAQVSNNWTVGGNAAFWAEAFPGHVPHPKVACSRRHQQPRHAAAFGFMLPDSVITKKSSGKSRKNLCGNQPLGRPLL